jgi:hypothetical protein
MIKHTRRKIIQVGRKMVEIKPLAYKTLEGIRDLFRDQ